jgi:hypothetical protein
VRDEAPQDVRVFSGMGGAVDAARVLQRIIGAAMGEECCGNVLGKLDISFCNIWDRFRKSSRSRYCSPVQTVRHIQGVEKPGCDIRK